MGETAPITEDLTELSLEELMDVTVTSFSKRPEILLNTAAALFVITREDILRSGATSIPEVLRMVPGLHVSQSASGTWSISCRGSNFNANFEDKMLVLIDGRSLHTPDYEETYWNEVDTVLEDIDRIEVVRGPGNSAWGSRAISGIVNIITRDTQKTIGQLVTLGGGSHDRFIAQARHGIQAGDHGACRAYIKFRRREPFADEDGSEGQDWDERTFTGFRTDLPLSSRSTLTFQGDMMLAREKESLSLTDSGAFPQTKEENTEKWTGALMAHLDHQPTSTTRVNAQFSCDHADQSGSTYEEKRDSLDLDINQSFSPLPGHRAQWGLGGGYSRISLDSEKSSLVDGDIVDETTLSGFLQDEILFAQDRWRLTLGTKGEYSENRRMEFMPSARLLFAPTPEHAVWTAVSRSVRIPDQGEQTIRVLNGVPILVSMEGVDDLEPEKVTAYELGYRYVPDPAFPWIQPSFSTNTKT